MDLSGEVPVDLRQIGFSLKLAFGNPTTTEPSGVFTHVWEPGSTTLPAGASFTFTVHAVYLPRPRVKLPGPQVIQASFDWQAAVDPVLERMCTVTLINDMAEYV